MSEKVTQVNISAVVSVVHNEDATARGINMAALSVVRACSLDYFTCHGNYVVKVMESKTQDIEDLKQALLSAEKDGKTIDEVFREYGV